MSNNDFRNLTVSEVRLLEKQNNYCSNWNDFFILIQNDEEDDSFTLSQIRNCTFNGIFEITKLFGSVDINTNTNVGILKKMTRTHIYNSHFFGQCRIGNCLISDCCMVSNVEVADGCVLMNCNSIVGSDCIAPCSFMNVGSECSNRKICLYSDTTDYLETCRLILGNPETRLSKLETCSCQHVPQWARMEGKCMYIGLGSKIIDSNLTHCHVDGLNTIISSDIDHSLLLRSDNRIEKSTVNRCVLHGHCAISQYSIVNQSLLYPHSGVAEQGKVFSSILGHDSGVSNGECHHCVLGSHTGFHHTSLLIAAIWIHGRGNLAYGAKIGGNHTGRMNDQECLLGEGCFLGLDTSVKFPFNMLHSPYSMVGGGTKCLNPQLIAYPFSLLSNGVGITGTGDKPCIKPGWVLTANPYIIERAQSKVRSRQKSKQLHTTYPIFRPYIIELVTRGMESLQLVMNQSESEGTLYSSATCTEPGLTASTAAGVGDCVIANQADVAKGIQSYKACIDRYMMQGLLIILCSACGRRFGRDLLLEICGGELEKEYVCSDRKTFIANILDIEIKLNKLTHSEPQPQPISEASSYNDCMVDMMVWMTPTNHSHSESHSQSQAHYRRIAYLLTHQFRLIYKRFNPTHTHTDSSFNSQSFWNEFLFSHDSFILKEQLNIYRTLSREWFIQVIKSRQRDYSKGVCIIPDYDTSHSLVPTLPLNQGDSSNDSCDYSNPSVVYAHSDSVVQKCRKYCLELECEIMEFSEYISHLPQ